MDFAGIVKRNHNMPSIKHMKEHLYMVLPRTVAIPEMVTPVKNQNKLDLNGDFFMNNG